VHDVSSSGRLAAWCGAALAGDVDPQQVAVAVAGAHDAPHRVHGLPGTPDLPLDDAVTLLGDLGATHVRLVLPVAGDPAGLPGPGAFNRTAIDAGAAVLAVGAGTALIASGRGSWVAYPVDADPRTPLTLREAERDLSAAVRDAADTLARLEVARWDPAAAGLRSDVSDHGWRLPPAADPAARRLLGEALRLSAVVEVAGANDGGSRTAGEMALRRQALRRIDIAVRRALEAACSTAPRTAAPRRATPRGQRSVR
jgi:hypothetical protein